MVKTVKHMLKMFETLSAYRLARYKEMEYKTAKQKDTSNDK